MWKIRIEYDNSIKDRIKQAWEGQSDAFTLLQKDMWLENRQIMNDVIKETAEGLKVNAKQSFSDMTSLYRARQNIISKTKLDLKGTPGRLSSETLKKNIIRFGIGWAGIKVFEKVTGFNVPVI